MKAVIYDCEIIKAIPPRDGVRLEGIEYCEGWGDHANMGVSVIGAYSYADDRYRVFCNDNFVEFVDLLNRSDLAVGFNNINFDDRLIAATDSIPSLNSVARYDILVEAWAAVGLGPTFDFKTHGGYGLDAICEATFGEKKSGNGALAPVDWQKGEIGTVIDYCLMDVRLTKKLFDMAVSGTPIKNPKTGDLLTLRKP
jgi:hypothetical protein